MTGLKYKFDQPQTSCVTVNRMVEIRWKFVRRGLIKSPNIPVYFARYETLLDAERNWLNCICRNTDCCYHLTALCGFYGPNG